MANYERRILVPYLQDVCSMEMLCAKLKRDIANANNEIDRLNRRIKEEVYVPSRPYRDNYRKSEMMVPSVVILILLGVIPLGLSIWGMIDHHPWFGVLLGLICGVFFGFVGLMGIVGATAEADDEYEKALKKFNQCLDESKKHQQQIPIMTQKKKEWENYLRTRRGYLNSAQAMCRELYAVNIIPPRYRNIHVAYYLYDFFQGSRETDLEKVIQTMLLDEIIQRLDKIIVQNEQIILNQRMEIALQEGNNKMIAENNRQQMLKLAQMERNQEMQLDYQHMIEKNQRVTNYLLAADYLKK